MSLYDRFEELVAIILSFVIAVVIALALVQLVIRLVMLLLSGAIDPLEPRILFSCGVIPPSPGGPDFQIGANWTSTAHGPANGSGRGLTLTWSFMPDGTFIPSVAGEPSGPSTLVGRLNGLYGSQSVWLPLFQQVFDAWSAVTSGRSWWTWRWRRCPTRPASSTAR